MFSRLVLDFSFKPLYLFFSEKFVQEAFDFSTSQAIIHSNALRQTKRAPFSTIAGLVVGLVGPHFFVSLCCVLVTCIVCRLFYSYWIFWWWLYNLQRDMLICEKKSNRIWLEDLVRWHLEHRGRASLELWTRSYIPVSHWLPYLHPGYAQYSRNYRCNYLCLYTYYVTI